MFINPQIAINEGWITFPPNMAPAAQAKCIQPNALDFTIDHINTISLVDRPYIGETNKQMRTLIEMLPTDGAWTLAAGLYDFMSDFYVDLPVGIAAMMITRSTFVRNGLFITSGLWDSGFRGNLGGVLHNKIGLTLVEQHVRVGQLIFVKSDAGTVYSGGYNTDPGVHWTSTLVQ